MDPDEQEQILKKIAEAENTLNHLKELVSSKQAETISTGELPSIDLTLSTQKLFETNGQEVFKIPGSVGLYFIVPNTRVRTAARSSILRVVRIPNQFVDETHPPAFIQVGEWIYPLTPKSLVYRSEHKYYLFPDLLSTTPGSSVGVVLPKKLSQEKRNEFEKVILDLLGLSEFPMEVPSSFGKSTDLILSARTSVSLVRTNSGVYSERSSQLRGEGKGNNQQRPQSQSSGNYGKRIGAGFKAGGQLLSRGFELGADGTANVMNFGTSCLKASLTRAETNQEVPGIIKDGADYAKGLTAKVLGVSSTLLSALSDVTKNFASLTACWVKGASAPFLDKAIECSGVSRSTIDDITSEIKDVGEGIVSGGYLAYQGLDNASNQLALALCNNAVEVIAHCYGPSAANVLQNAGEVVGNVALTGMNAGQVISPTQVLDSTTKQAGLSLALDDCKN